DLRVGRLREAVVAIEDLVADIFERLSVKLVGAALGDDVDHAASGQTLIRVVLDGVDLELVYGAHGEVLARVTRFGRGVGDAIHRESVGPVMAGSAHLDAVVERSGGILRGARL